MAAVVLINGVRQGWGDISFVAYGRVFTGITEIDIKSSQEKGNEMGAGRHAVHRSRGNKKYEGHSITLYHYEVFAILKALGAGKDLTDAAPVTVNIVFTPEGADTLTRIDIPMWEFTDAGTNISPKQGDKSIAIKLGAISGLPVFTAP